MHRLSLIKLEERIVLDGAGLNNILDNTSCNDTFYVDRSLPYVEAESHVSPQPVVLVVSSDISDHEQLELAADENTIVVSYDAQETTLEQLIDQIEEALHGDKASSIAFANHGTEKGSFYLTANEQVSLKSLLKDRQIERFWQQVGDLIEEDGRIDLLACDLGKSPDKIEFAAQLELLTKKAIAFSDNKIGSSDLGGNWVLEGIFTHGKLTKADLDVSKTYFNVTRLKGWFGELATPIDGSVSDNSVDNVLTNQPILTFIDAPQALYSSDATKTAFGRATAADDKGMVIAGQSVVEFFDPAGSGWARTSSFTSANTGYGIAVAISGDWAVVGDNSASTNSGEIKIYKRTNTAWALSQTIINPGGTGQAAQFGSAVAIYSDSTTSTNNKILVGAPAYSSNTGGIYFYKYNGSTWSISGSIINPTDGTSSTNDYFGCSISMSATRAVVGAYGDNTNGAAYIFDYSSSWDQSQRLIASGLSGTAKFGSQLALDGDRIAVGAYSQAGQGAVYIFEKGSTAGSWTQTAQITSADLASTDQFGYSVALKGNALLIGANLNDTAATDAGSAYLYEKKTNGWAQIKHFTDTNSSASQGIGAAAALNSQYAVVGITADDTLATNAGKASIYRIKDNSIGLNHYKSYTFEVDQTARIVDGSGISTLLAGALDVKVSGNYAYVISTTDQGLTIFDISNPNSPVHKGQLTLGVTPSAFDIYKNCLYIASSGGNQFNVVDISIPTNPSIFTSIPANGVDMLKVSGNYLYVHTATDTSLRSYDISAANSPTLTGVLIDGFHLAASTGPNGIYIEGNYLYITNSGNTISIINISIPASLSYAAQITGVTATPQAVAVKNNYLYVLGNTGNSIQIYDISTPTSPSLAKALSNNIDGNYLSGLASIQIEGNYAYVSSLTQNGVSVIDITNPLSAKIVKEIVTGTHGVTGLNGVKGLYINNGYLYTADSVGNALSVYKLNVPDKDNFALRGLRFDGSLSAVLFNNFTGINGNAYTIEFWMKAPPLVTGRFPGIFSYAVSAASSNQLFIGFQESSSNMVVILNENYLNITSGTTAFLDDSFHHLAFTYNQTTSAWIVYRDGVVFRSGTFSCPPLVDGGVMVLGQDQDNLGGGFDSTQCYNGTLDELRVWNTVRTQSQIMANMRTKLTGNETGLKAYYRFDEESGQRVYDMSQNKQNGWIGTNSSVESRDASRVVSMIPMQTQSIYFDGANNIVSVAHSGPLDAYPLTISAWVKTTTNTTVESVILNKCVEASSNGYNFYVYNGNICAYYYKDSSNYIFGASGSFNGGYIADGTWHYVCFSIDSTGGKLYVDGTLKNSLAWIGTGAATTTNSSLTIGGYANQTKTFAGEISQVSVWNTALTQSNIQNYMKVGLTGAESNLLAYYSFNEGAGSTLRDVSVNGFNGTLYGGTWRDAPNFARAVNTALYFDGVNDLATINHNTNFDTYPITISFWINTKTSDATARGIVNKYAVSSNNGYQLYLYNGTIVANYYKDASNYVANGNSFCTGAVADGRWHYISFTVETNGGKLYVDGALALSQSWSGMPGATTTIQNILLGSYNGAYFNGSLDELAFWNTALTQQQIQDFMFNPIPNYQTGLVAYYKFDEGSGQYIYDNSGNGYNGHLGASTSVGSDDPQYIMSNARIHNNRYLIGNRDVILTIGGYDPDSMTASGIIKTLPNQGTLYQYSSVASNLRGAAITANTTISDSLRRVVYSPSMTGASSYSTVSFSYSLSDGTNSTAPSNVYINLLPPSTITGTAVATSPINDTTTTTPFTGVSFTNTDQSKQYTYSITLDNAAKGIFTTASLTTGGFTSAGSGVYTLTATPTVAQAAIKQLVFDPTDNRVAFGKTETTTFTITSTDGSVLDSITTVVATTVNDPCDITTSSSTTPYILGTVVTEIDFAATFTDSDVTSSGAKLIVQITSGASPKDNLVVKSIGTGAGQINVVGNTVKYGSIIIGTHSGSVSGNAQLTIVLNNNATAAAITALIRSIAFYNGDKTSLVGNRIVTYTYNDNAGSIDTATKTVNVTATATTPWGPPTSSILNSSAVTSVYNSLMYANQYSPSMKRIASYLQSYFFYR
ncbi:MAG: hypothetical protein K0S74_1415 [Chlamydiales bacterium]|jgi:hypothetical protein|nr:hypothetical protein [Chlamydiales bacterium]